MPFELGNELGKKPKLFDAALRRAIKQEDGKRIREAAEQLLTLAAQGEQWAIKELADRLDGKPAQAVETEVNVVHYVAELPPVAIDVGQWERSLSGVLNPVHRLPS